MGYPSGTSLNLTDGFGVSSRWSRSAAAGPTSAGPQPAMARDTYTRERTPNKLTAPPSYAVLRAPASRAARPTP